MIETIIGIVIILVLVGVVWVQMEEIEEKKRGQREGRLDYYGNKIDD